MTFGQQPGNGDPYYGGNQQQPAYGQQQYGQSQYSYAPNGTAAINAQTIYSREQVQAAQRASVTRAYGEMTLGLIITAVVAVVAQMTGAYVSFIESTGLIGFFGFAIVQVVLAVALRPHHEDQGIDRPCHVLRVRGADGIHSQLHLPGVQHLRHRRGPGPVRGVLLRAHHVLVDHEIRHAQGRPHPHGGPGGADHLPDRAHVRSGQHDRDAYHLRLRLILFAGMTLYDAQQTRALFSAYEAQGPEMIKKISIICALNLYLDFVNMFLYILQLFGSRD